MTPPKITHVLDERERKRFNVFLSELKKFPINQRSRRDFFKHMARIEKRPGYSAPLRFMTKYRPLFEAAVPGWASKGRPKQRGRNVRARDDEDDSEEDFSEDTSSEEDEDEDEEIDEIDDVNAPNRSTSRTREPSSAVRLSLKRPHEGDDDEGEGSQSRFRSTPPGPPRTLRLRSSVLMAAAAAPTNSAPRDTPPRAAQSTSAPATVPRAVPSRARPIQGSYVQQQHSIGANSVGHEITALFGQAAMALRPWHAAEIERLRDANAKLSVNVQELESEAATPDDAIPSLRDMLKAQRDSAKTERDTYKAKRDDYKAERDEYKLALDAFRAEFDTLKAERDNLKAGVNRATHLHTMAMTSKGLAHSREMQALKEQLKDSERENEDLSKASETEQRQRRKLEDAVGAITNGGNAVEAEQQALRAAIEGELKAALEAELKTVIEAELKTSIEGELKPMLEAQFKTALKTELAAERQRMRPAIETEIKAGVEADIRAAVEGARSEEKRMLEAEARNAVNKQLRDLEDDKQKLRTQVIDVQAQLINLLQSTQLPMHER